VRVLVTGGSGFLGRAVCELLARSGHSVRVLCRRAYTGPGRHLAGDLRRYQDVEAAVRGCAAVVHSAAKAGYWGPRAEFHETNVVGTAHVITACLRQSVPRLVYTSSPSVVHNGANLEGVDESAPYATTFLAPYPETKAAAERLVLAANSPRLATVALRPHLIWGPDDPHFLPRLLDRARQGRLWIAGDGASRIDTIYLDNAADAHLLALERLEPGAPIAGRAYFVAQDDPRPIREVIGMWLAAAGVPVRPRQIPVAAARMLAHAVELGYRLSGARSEPPLTRFLVQQLTTAHWFDIGAARRDLGYTPRIGTEEGLALLRAHLHNQHRRTAT
jgi:nucleoside-diphosphate-sugar epimerase